MSELVRLEKKEGVGEIIMNSPPANAMSKELLEQLSEIVDQIRDDREVRAVLLRSEVPKIFMAGADLKMMLSLGRDEFKQYIKRAQDIYNSLESLPQPTIAVISGHALGGGCELTLCCDFRFMSRKKARIGLPEVTLGLLPGAGGTQRLPRLIGMAKARELLIWGSQLTGEDALEIGLVDKVFEPDELLPESIKIAKELATKATLAIGKIKECLRVPPQEILSRGLEQELEGITYLFADTEDTKEGIAAFNEKRAPKYRGR
nr:hypothetical protein [Desulfobacterales bacterium]